MNLWDFKAIFYDSARKFFPFNFILSKEVANLNELISKLNLENAKILDVGAGPGTVLNDFPPGVQVTAVDISLRMIEKAKTRSRKNFIVANALALPIKSGSVDLIAVIGLLEYQKEQIKLIEEVQRTLAPNGHLLLTYSHISVLNYLRILLAHRIYLLSFKQFNKLIHRTGLTCSAKKKSLIQRQVLLHNKSKNDA